MYALDAMTGAKVWSFKPGDDVDSSPAVADGIVYFGSRDTNVYALDAATGAKLWTYQTGGTIECSPAVSAGIVYIQSRDHNVYALDSKTGAKVWSVNTGGGNDPSLPGDFRSSPAVSGGTVYIASGGFPNYKVFAFGGLTMVHPPPLPGPIITVGGVEVAGPISIIVGVTQDGGGIGVAPNGGIIRIPPGGPPDPVWSGLSQALGDIVEGLGVIQNATHIENVEERKATEKKGRDMVTKALRDALKSTEH